MGETTDGDCCRRGCSNAGSWRIGFLLRIKAPPGTPEGDARFSAALGVLLCDACKPIVEREGIGAWRVSLDDLRTRLEPVLVGRGEDVDWARTELTLTRAS